MTLNAGCGVQNAVEIAADDVTLANMRVDGAADNGIVVEGRSGVRLKNIGVFAACVPTGAAVRLVQVDRLRLSNVRGGIFPIGTYVADLATGARVKLTWCGGEGSPFGGQMTGVLVENVAPGALTLRTCQVSYAVDAGIDLRNADGVRITGGLILGRGTSSSSRGIVVDANSDDNVITRNRLRDNAIDVVDLGAGNCWRGNSNPSGNPLTGNPSSVGCR